MANNKTKNRIVKAASAFALICGSVLVGSACSKGVSNKSVPYGDLTSNTYVQAGTYKVTEKELYDELKLQKSSNGFTSITTLNNLIAQKVLQSKVDYLKAVWNGTNEGENVYSFKYTEEGKEFLTEQEYLQKIFKQSILSQVYSTSNEDTIAKYTTSQKDLAVLKYEDSMLSQGITFTTSLNSENVVDETMKNEDLLDQFLLSQAKVYIAKDYVSGKMTDKDSSYYFDEDKDYETYYNSNAKTAKDEHVLVLKFLSLKEANDALAMVDFNASDDVDVLKDMVAVYNSIYSYRKALSYEGSSLTEVVNSLIENNEDLAYSVSDLSSYNSALQSYVNDTLSVKDENYYADHLLSFGTTYYMVFKLSDSVTPEYADVTNEENENYDANVNAKIKNDYVLSKCTSSVVATAIDEIFSKAKITVYDPYLESLYVALNDSQSSSKKSSKTNVASVKYEGETYDISVRSLYEELENVYGPSTAFDMLSTKVILDSDYMSEVTASEKSQHEADLKEIVSNYKAGSYASYGITKDLKENDFYKLYFNKGSKAAVLKEYYQANRAIEIYLKDYTAHSTYNNATIYEEFENVTKENYEATFSITLFHFLIYVDFEDSGSVYSPRKYMDTLTDSEKQLYKDLIVELTNKIYTMLQFATDEAGNVLTKDGENVKVTSTYSSTLDWIINDYNHANRLDSSNQWSKFVNAGLKLKKEDLGEITNKSVLNYDQDFAARVVELAEMNLDLTDIDETQEGSYMDKLGTEDNPYVVTSYDQLLETEFGYHLLFVTAQKENVSAKYTASLDSKENYTNITYTDREGSIDAYSSNNWPSANQIEIYLREKDYKTGIENLPSSTTNEDGDKIKVTDTITTFFKPLFDLYTGDSNSLFLLTSLVLEKGNVEFANAADADLFKATLKVAERSFSSYSYETVDFMTSPYENWFDVFYGANQADGLYSKIKTIA